MTKKSEYPPQGGECWICCSVFISLLLVVLSAVTMIYGTVIVYIPSLQVLNSDLKNGFVCTTMSSQMNLRGAENCQGWSTCEEWCLGVSPESCNHLQVSVRTNGATIQPLSCQDVTNHTCQTLHDLTEVDCKQYVANEEALGKRCAHYDEVVLSCEAGICKNISAIYQCSYQSKLDDIKKAQNGDGECSCVKCRQPNGGRYLGKCHPLIEYCLSDEGRQNGTSAAVCQEKGCFNCWNLCSAKKECFDMKVRSDSTLIGRDQFGRPLLKYYACIEGHCEEIYNLSCKRRCEDIKIDPSKTNYILLHGEKLFQARCSKIQVNETETLELKPDQLLVVTCSRTIVKDQAVIGEDCVNGTFLEERQPFNYSTLVHQFLSQVSKVGGIPSEIELIAKPSTRLQVNLEGCVNTLRDECVDFFSKFGQDGRNSTARSIFPCFYDTDSPARAVVDYNKDATFTFLVLFSTIPCAIFLLSCFYCCFCNKLVHVAEDGRLRLRFKGNYYSGIGRVNSHLKFDKRQ
ncbi:hypothetical protein TCAL_03339 [Tigriopus californicus]|uniref:Uncharacterized protein n=1 Tax=Tigriopus californicus TaxID=6832 RepID=A0A553P5T1_TIGCA|nr:uncharacterized protein LOC131877896 [Tigriopus californicus]TRY73043.1 hypothetical protein TCAL_03339 [Tigriopus californicus]|eukprot:TCALIF_03339-PA protein Name:"Protein of unknown function" AED:0.02 eAED:0.06 QI:0/-1/0/1/-1/1/1/0/514